MKLNSIPALLRQSSNYCFIFSKNRKHKINWEEQEAVTASDTESLGLWIENSCLFHGLSYLIMAMIFLLLSAGAEPGAAPPL